VTSEAVAEPIRFASARGRGALGATVLASGMAFLDGTIVNVAAKHIGTDFHASFGALQWVLNGYTLSLASLILLGGSLGDLFGRRRVFLVGVVSFAAASLLCAAAPNVTVLIAARVVQGVGGALLTPGSLAIISATFHPDDRARAVGAWSGLAGVSTALGPLLGGWLVQDYSWRWAFGINAPLAVGVVVLALRYVPETRSHAGAVRHIDVRGTMLVALALAGLTYGPTRAGASGWDAIAIASTVTGVAVGVLFILTERLERQPLVPLSLFADRQFSGTNAMTLFTYAALGAVFFALVLNLQVGAGYGALSAGLATLPLTALMLLFSARSGALATRIGPRLQLIVGPLICAAGLILLYRVDAQHRSYLVDVLPGIVLFGVGLTTLVAPLTATVMGAAPPDSVGIASGVNNAVARAGGLLAVAVLPPLAGFHGENYRQVHVMVHGYRVITTACIVLLVAAALVVAATVRNQVDVRSARSEDTHE
jgi:EmrB/QacA subfamily drug resistance transporter